MAKKSVIARDNKKRERLRLRDAEKRAALKEIIRTTDDPEEMQRAQDKLCKLPRNGSKVRRTRRCAMPKCGRPHAVYRKFKLCRIHLRELLMRGEVTGGGKASW